MARPRDGLPNAQIHRLETNGGRGIGNQVESLLINPLSRWLFDNEVLGDAQVVLEDFDLAARPPCVRCRLTKEDDHA